LRLGLRLGGGGGGGGGSAGPLLLRAARLLPRRRLLLLLLLQLLLRLLLPPAHTTARSVDGPHLGSEARVSDSQLLLPLRLQLLRLHLLLLLRLQLLLLRHLLLLPLPPGPLVAASLARLHAVAHLPLLPVLEARLLRLLLRLLPHLPGLLRAAGRAAERGEISLLPGRPAAATSAAWASPTQRREVLILPP